MTADHEQPAQTERVLEHLRQYGSLSAVEALEVYGCRRLAARIWELRNRGLTILTSLREVENRYGEPCRVAVYTLRH